MIKLTYDCRPRAESKNNMKNETKTESAPAQHDATPWKSEPVKGAFESHVWRVAGGSVLLATVGGLNHAANGQFIVAACNSHDALVAERDRLRRVLESVAFPPAEYRSRSLPAALEQQIRAALAEGGMA